MSRLTIDTGTAGNPATGDSLRTAFTKVNTNFTELYAELGGDSLDAISFTNNTISTDITNANLILTGNGTGGVIIEDIEITGSTVNVLTTNNNLTLNTNGTGKVVINGLSYPTADGTAGQVLKTDGAGNLSFTAVDPGAITFVGDDSTGTAVNIGETFKIAGSGTVTTAVSGDTITITGTAPSTGDFAFSGNTLSTASSNADIELDPAGTGNLILKSGNFLPATDNTQYLGSVSKRWHTLYVGPGSININGVTISESGGSIQIPGGFTGTQGLASIILPDPNNLPYGNQNDNLGAPFDFDTATIFYDHHTYLYIANKVASGGIWSGWTVGQGYPESLGFTPATFIHYSIGGALTQLILLTGGSGLSNVATDNVMAFRPGDPITTVLATPYSGILGTVNSQGTSQPSLTTTSTLTSGGTFTAQDESLFFDNINLQSNANIVFPDSTTQSTAARITVVGDDSTGTTFNAGETVKIAGTQNITTAVSGDILTITGPDLSSYATQSYVDTQVGASNTLTIKDDTSTSISINLDNTLEVLGASGISTSVSGGTLTITGPDLSSYLTNSTITFVGDDSTGVTLNSNETIKIAGTQNITTAVSGDTVTITGPDLSSYATQSYVTSQGYITNSPITVVGDDSTGTTLNTGETIKFVGTQNITTAVSGDTLTITGPDLTNYAQKTDKAITIVGDDSTGTDITIGETFKIAGTQNITTAVSGDTLTITGPNLSSYLTSVPSTIEVNEISSSDSSAIQINDAINVSGAGTFHGSVRFNAGYIEKINALTSSSTITVNCATASIHTVYLETNSGFVISNLPTGGSVTLIITQDSTGSRTATFGTDTSTTVKFAGGTPALSTASNSIDVVTIFNDGTNYLGNIAKAYA